MEARAFSALRLYHPSFITHIILYIFTYIYSVSLAPPPSVVHERAVEELAPQVVEEDIVQQVLVHDLSAANPYSDVRGTETSPPSHMEEHFEQ